MHLIQISGALALLIASSSLVASAPTELRSRHDAGTAANDKELPAGPGGRAGLEARAGGGLGQILSDHFKFVADPPSAVKAIPVDQNNPAREAHRSVHAALFEVTQGGAQGGAQGGNGADN